MKLFNFSKKQIRENVVTKQSYILIAKESFIDHIRCIHETGCCYWRKKHGKGDKKWKRAILCIFSFPTKFTIA